MTASPTGPRVLVVEDDSAIRATLVDILELNGYGAIQAATGTAGLAQAREQRPDVILTDIAMPELDGFGMITALHADEQTRAIPVIIISAAVEPERMRQGMDLGAEDFIVKPFTEEQVLGSIRARLEKKALLDELDAFAHTVAHDLKNPIAVLMGRAELLRALWDTADDATLLEQVVQLESNAVRLNNIVEELLILAGVRRQVIEPEPLPMAEVVREALGRVENLVRSSHARIEQPDTWPSALGHAPWVAEVWTNYLSNALKYGGTPPLIRLGAGPAPAGGRVRFWIEDNGPGLTPEQQAQLFRQFSRVTQARTGGHGLGLSIVRRIVEKLDGRAGVESQPGAGSRFWFELPATPTATP
ncbi:MAG: HAMP domain-containing histidine kinase [Verrucomicrobia bacterium]|nr:HAMP domain-containing histidine kinase [Verrucomicrobiota bacterium]